MKLIHAPAVGLRDRDEVIVDLNLLALFRQMAEEMRAVAADCTDVRAFQFQRGSITQLIKSKSTVHGELVLIDLPKFLLLRVELVLNIAHQLFEHIFKRDHADGAAKFVHHHGKMRVLSQEKVEKFLD